MVASVSSAVYTSTLAIGIAQHIVEPMYFDYARRLRPIFYEPGHRGIIVDCIFVLDTSRLTLIIGPQSSFGDKLLIIYVLCPPHIYGTAVL